MTTWFIAGIRYPSGREIFVGDHPTLAEFTACRDTAAHWPGEQAAREAVASLLQAFQLVNPGVLKTFILPVR